MAVPKRRTSRAKRDQRRSRWRLKAPHLIPCPQCHEPKPAHRVCLNCGYYKDHQVIKVK